jgi:hypothetical protein
MMETKSRFYQNLIDSCEQKYHLLKSIPRNFTRETLKFELEGTHFNLVKVYIPCDYTKKPVSYRNESNKVDFEIFENVDYEKFNFTKKNPNETIMYILGNEFYIQEDGCLYNDEYSTIVHNIFPLVNLHMLFLPFYSKILPQFLSDPLIIEKVLEMQEIMKDPDLM